MHYTRIQTMAVNPFEIFREGETTFFRESLQHPLSEQQVQALDRTEEEGLLAGKRIDDRTFSLRSYELPEGAVPFSDLSPDVKEAFLNDAFEALQTANAICGIPTDTMRAYLVHMNFPAEGDHPVTLLPSFIAAIDQVQALGGIATNS